VFPVPQSNSSILTRDEILYYLSARQPVHERLFVSPLLEREQVGDTSVDLRLGHHFLVSQPSRLGVLDLIDLHNEGKGILSDNYREVRIPYGQFFTLHPASSVRVGTLEYLGIPYDLQGIVTLRASFSDLPIVANVAQVHPGHKGIVTLSLTSNAEFSIRLYPGARMAELQLQRLDPCIAKPRKSRYHRMTKPVSTRLYEDRDLSYLGPTVEPIIIGFATTIAAGRTTAVGHLLDMHGFTFLSLADVLKSEAIARGIPTRREELQRLGTELRQLHGPAYLAEKFRTDPKWLSSKSALVIVDSFKNEAEVKEFRKQKRFTLLGIDAPEELRWERVRSRRRQGDPETYADFQYQDRVDRGLSGDAHGQQLERLLAIADRVIMNHGTVEAFLAQVDKAVADLLHPSLTIDG